ncbi:MAG: pilus assembly protein [Candidatus Protistobacter heckmanni]|nr:pilus assembly protein [Candidatus Protistobacter heckmanni]
MLNARRRGANAAGARGGAMLEFLIALPVLTLAGLAVFQAGLLFQARNMIGHAIWAAARAGSIENASTERIVEIYRQALQPLDSGYGGIAGIARIEILSPTREAFADWNDAELQRSYRTGGKRVIPQAGLEWKDWRDKGGASGASIHEANLIHLRVTHGYRMQIPFVGEAIAAALRRLRGGGGGRAEREVGDAFADGLWRDGRVPVVAEALMHMQTDAVEPDDFVLLP